MSKKYMRDLVPLVAICLISALLLASFNLLTKDPIEQNTLRAAEETRTRMLPSAAAFEPVELDEGSNMDSFYQGLDASGDLVGYVIQTTVNGYAGEVVVTLGMDMDGIITGVDVGGENFSETPGLGALAKEPGFTQQYIGKKAPLKLIKSNETKAEDTIDAISGATRTSSAVNGGINLAGKYISDLSGASSPNTASAQGFGGPVAVTLELDQSGAISSITIGDDYFNETEGYGLVALEDSFAAQFIGKTPPLTLSDIDAISGATVTSTAVVNAINTVYGQLTGEAAPAAPNDETPSAQFYEDGAWRASFQGFAGPVTVKLTLDGLTIQEIEIGDAEFKETEGYGARALEPDFQSQFVGKTLPVTAQDIDGLSGATVTTDAVLDGIEAIYQAAVDGTNDEPQPLPDEPEAADDAESHAATGSSAGAVMTEDKGTWTASAQGYNGPVAVKLALADDLTITSISIGDESFSETEGFGQRALDYRFKLQFLGKTLPLTDGDIDALAGATVTTDAVLDAVEAIYQAAKDASGGSVPDAPEATASPAVTRDGNGVWTASAQGYNGPVAVKLALADDLTITSISIGDESFSETEGFGQRALDYRFKLQFLGKTLPLTDGDIDALAGATVTTDAVLDAIEAIYQAAKDASGGSVPVAPEATASPAVTRDGNGVWTASAQGYNGPVAVKLALADDLTITSISIGDESFNETEGFGQRALDYRFKLQFLGKTLPLTDGDIDALAGATVTTDAVLDAIEAIYQAAK